MFTGFKPYLEKSFVLFNDDHHLNRGLQPETTPNHDVLLAKLKRFDFENALRDVENWKLDRLSDFLLDLPVFHGWTRKQARKLLQSVKYEKVLRGWEKFQKCQAVGEKIINTPETHRLYMVLEGEFEYESLDREGNASKKKGGSALKDMDLRKLLFSRKKVTIDDRRKFTQNGDINPKDHGKSNKAALLLKTFKPQIVYLEKGTFFGEEYLFADERCFGDRPAIVNTMDRLVAKEIIFRLSCKSLDGIVMSISVDEFIRMLNKDDPTIKKLRNQFMCKTKIQTAKMIDDLEAHGESEEDDDKKKKKKKKKANDVNPLEDQSKNPMKMFRMKQ
jgi:hypothetical protein